LFSERAARDVAAGSGGIQHKRAWNCQIMLHHPSPELMRTKSRLGEQPPLNRLTRSGAHCCTPTSMVVVAGLRFRDVSADGIVVTVETGSGACVRGHPRLSAAGPPEHLIFYGWAGCGSVASAAKTVSGEWAITAS